MDLTARNLEYTTDTTPLSIVDGRRTLVKADSEEMARIQR